MMALSCWKEDEELCKPRPGSGGWGAKSKRGWMWQGVGESDRAGEVTSR